MVSGFKIHDSGSREWSCQKPTAKSRLSYNLSYVKSYVCLPGSHAKIPLPKYYRDRIPGYYDVNPKKSYNWLSEPDFYDKFSRKYLRSRGLLGKRTLVNRLLNCVDKLTSILDDSYSYFLYRDEIFHRKYDKMNKNDNQ